MIPRAVPDVAQLNDNDLFAEIAQGMRHALTNALRLWRDASLLSRNRRPQGFQIIRFLAEEEAAKFHILLDAARCPRDERFARHLRYFSDHLARGLYAEYYTWLAMSLEEAREHIDRERQTLYLDGPCDVDWIFRNDIERRREDAMYADYIAIRDQFHDEHQWHCPNPQLLRMCLPGIQPEVLRVADAIHHAGIAKPGAIAMVAETWRKATPESLTREQVRKVNLKTLNHLEDAGLLRTATQEVYGTVVNEWRAPLYPLDLRRLEVKRANLREEQERLPPDYY